MDAISHSPETLGAHYDPKRRGTQFTVYAGAKATGVQLCLFKSLEDTRAARSIRLEPVTDFGALGGAGRLWSVFVEGVESGQLYGYRVDGPWDPRNGARYNPNKLLIDPYAKALGRNIRWHESLLAYTRAPGNRDADLIMSTTDSAPFAPLGMVISPSNFDWQGVKLPKVPWRQTVLYELHVKGQTNCFPGTEPRLRGTYLGLASPKHIDHLKRLGVTHLELMPMHESPPHGVDYSNYWKYDTLGFFLPNREFSIYRRAIDGMDEFKEMVLALHRAGIGVILDVVFNHTAEGNEFGPSLSLRGFANEDYYRLCGVGEDGGPYRGYVNHSGCGNTLNMANPVARRLVIDSLLWWTREYRVDGFRFDLAGALLDEELLRAIEEHPELSASKLIAEPWHANGYHLGLFHKPWREWCDRYRDDIRKFVRGDANMLAAFANRLYGSRNDFPEASRGASVSVNFVTCHDGFPLRDLVSYTEKHNDDNGEANADGSDNNNSANYGVEGDTDDPTILRLRRKQQRNFIMVLGCSNGVPMILGGDEVNRTQRGNNNAYPHDSLLSWTDWNDPDSGLTEFFTVVFGLRHRFPALAWAESVRWLTPQGNEMQDADWHDSERRCLAVELPGEDLTLECKRRVLLLVNMHPSAECHFILPPGSGHGWDQLLDTAPVSEWAAPLEKQTAITLEPRSIRLYVEALGA